MILYNLDKEPIELDKKPFAAGGEGEIYDIVNYSNVVAKIYKEHIDVSEREKKLLAMVESPLDEEQMKQIAWPWHVLYTAQGKFKGFVMYKLEINDDLNVFYEYGSTSKYPNLPWSKKITIAKNLCVAIGAVHKAGHVVGDFNPKNISVNSKTGLITMLDADSYHISDGEYRCTVGMPDYLPVEVQKKMKKGGLANASLPTFTEHSDNFSLAIHIFQLLMNGVHPFACALKPGQQHRGASLPSDNIIKCHTAFFRKVRYKIPPKFAPSIKILPKEIITMFKLAFVKGHKKPKLRPTSDSWFKVLSKIRESLVACKTHSWHEHPVNFKKCPWCKADDRFIKTRSDYSKDVKAAARARKREKLEAEKKEYERIHGKPFVAPTKRKKRVLMIVSGLVVVGALVALSILAWKFFF